MDHPAVGSYFLRGRRRVKSELAPKSSRGREAMDTEKGWNKG
jgi:hypothetical protein